jgi:hypothetical protein
MVTPLGKGAFGQVDLMKHKTLGLELAVKVRVYLCFRSTTIIYLIVVCMIPCLDQSRCYMGSILAWFACLA